MKKILVNIIIIFLILNNSLSLRTNNLLNHNNNNNTSKDYFQPFTDYTNPSFLFAVTQVQSLYKELTR